MHLTIRVAWHDDRWNGTICRMPSFNPFCTALDRIRASRDDSKEDGLAGREWADLDARDLPPCKAEGAAFMTPRPWLRLFDHPYQSLPKTRDTHGHLRPTSFTVPPYSTFAVPFWWMNRDHQDEIDESVPEALPPDELSPFPSAWVFSSARQEALVQLVFKRVEIGKSLAFFYTKEGHPLGDEIRRLVVGLGTITAVGRPWYYETSDQTRPTYLIWDRLIGHSIRPDGGEGFLVPYHDYLEPTGDLDEDARRAELAGEIAVVPPADHMRIFSYGAELASPDVALTALTRCMEVVRQIKSHGVAKGPWNAREDWLNEHIARIWKERGAFPGLGSALEAIGLRLGTALSLDLLAAGLLASEDDPWPVVDGILRGSQPPPKPAYQGDVDAVARTWAALSAERQSLLRLLSRFDLTPTQATRWFNPEKRPVPLSDEEILGNPYRVSEVDLGDRKDGPISVGVIDRGVLPDATIASRYPVPDPSNVDSQLDPRRVRAALVRVLRLAAEQGDSLLAEGEAMSRLERVNLAHPCTVTTDWLNANAVLLSGVVERFPVLLKTATLKEPNKQIELSALQLTELRAREDRLCKVLLARAARPLPSTEADWKQLVIRGIEGRGGKCDPDNQRHVLALEEQASALERITTRKLSVLAGRAGTGKTSALGALLLCDAISPDGILLLAPTGKARVLLGKASGGTAMTVAQFLYSQKRYDGERQRPLFEGADKYRREKTVVIDESSMLTMDDLYAVLEALDLVHVQRVILVGDPNQLPPIGVGRPFADLVGRLELAAESADAQEQTLAAAMGRLTAEVRAAAKAGSDTLRLASWFTREQQPADADVVFSDLEQGKPFNDLDIRFWNTHEQLGRLIFETFCDHLNLASADDIKGFDQALGLTEERWVPYEKPEGAENFQILSPVRMHPHGIYELNRLVQRQFRGAELDRARRGQRLKLGEEEIVVRDKVIQLQNQRRKAYDWGSKSTQLIYLANGEVGICATEKSGFMNVAFAGRPNHTVGYRGGEFPSGSGPLELAYALTVHKAQGSEFRKVFVILPQRCRLLTRELLYTALTRSREQLVLLVEGSDASILYEYTRPERSETARRNTNLFQGAIREDADAVPYAEHLIHRALKGHMVRSKSELVITNMLYEMGIDYQYEQRLDGARVPGTVRPDFLFADPAGDPIVWEHLGMLSRADYRQSWEHKRCWYLDNGFAEGVSLFTTQDDHKGGLDSAEVRKVAEQVAGLL
ncbi:MAG TPA: ATP-dependent RecD-like DNA helicase [Anaerolineae bacterium]|nr:ATP-dependent RecD-like DNA helicase [Anaerolineae bacterium]